MSLIVESIRRNLDANRQHRILEFGTGDGFQIPYLQTLGSVVGSDIYTSRDLESIEDFEFFETSIAESPFVSKEFDVIFSNHVIEHIEGLPKAFSELLRIGCDECLYAFSVPTNCWLLLSIPGQYWNRFREVVRRLRGREVDTKTASQRAQAKLVGKTKEGRSLFTRTIRALLPHGHGVERRFFRCYRSFRIRNWQELFVNGGFTILETRPLLLYGPSQWPIIPTTASRGRLCSSVLFLLKKKRDVSDGEE